MRTETRFPSGVTTTTDYDPAGRISSVLSAKNGQVLAGSTYPVIDKANRRKQIGEPDGSSWTYDYNTRGEVIRGEKQDPAGNLLDGFRFTYQYDQIGNRITATTGAPDLVASFAANALNQYAQITTPQAEFVRGAAQGATSVTVNGQAIPLKPDGTFNARVYGSGPATIVATAADGSTSTETRTVALPPPTLAPQYDADGNLLNDGLWTYTWDGENRLIALESTPTNPMPERIFKRFTYDYQSRRISEERHVFDPAAGTATGGAGAYVLEKAIRWVNDGWNQSVELLNDRPIRAYVWGLDLSGTRDGAGGVGGLLSSVDLLAGTEWDYLYDGNGNVGALTASGDGRILGRYQYGPFGAVSVIEGVIARLNRVRFSTKMQDLDDQTSYFGYRSYASYVGRWSSRDPGQEAGGLNLYGMVTNNPTNKWDYLGLKGCRMEVRCGLVAAGFYHCGVYVNGTEFGIGGGPRQWHGQPGLFKAAGTPEEYARPAPKGAPSGMRTYPGSCSCSCDWVEQCIRDHQAATIPPDYSALLGPNSNTYAHRLLHHCGCILAPHSFYPETVRYGVGDHLSPGGEPKRVPARTSNTPPDAPNWNHGGWDDYPPAPTPGPARR